jgi:UDPglucose 6-dehydrogenase
MRVTVQGLWHLGSVTAACLAAAGHDVVGHDEEGVVSELMRGRPPLFEPGLAKLVQSGLDAGRLSFTTDPSRAAAGAEVCWVTFDTPVDEDDVADISYVTNRVEALLPSLPDGCLVVVSSQLPVGSVRTLAKRAHASGRGDLTFACSPENLRLGKAIEAFTKSDRVIFGLQRAEDERKVRALLAPIADSIVFMSIESAEMTKHAINSFLAMSVAFANEIATVCEAVDADAGEVASGLKTEARIGPKAYVSPGAAFAGGTLARDIAFISKEARAHGLELALIPSVAVSNRRHRAWPLDRLRALLGEIKGSTVAILGLTYKAGTSTLRRSSSVELAGALVAAGARVRAYDPAVPSLPADTDLAIELRPSLETALQGADAAVIATEWPEFRDADWARLIGLLARPIVLDPNGLLAGQLGKRADVTYASVGRTTSRASGGMT